MAKYIYTDRNDIYIVDLKKTLKLLREACVIVRDIVAAGGQGLFVGTKKQANEAIKHWAEQSNQYYINNRWLGGLLTNWDTVGKRVKRLIELEKMFKSGENEKYSKKEQSQYSREMLSLRKNLDGVKKMKKLPSFIFVIDPNKEHIAVHEANKLNIPVVGVVDTNCDPDPIDIPIPANDDAIRAINLMCQKIAESCIDGMIMRVEAGLESPDYLPEEVRRQIMGSAPAEETAPEVEQPEVQVVVSEPVSEPVATAPTPEVAPEVAPAPQPTGDASPPAVQPPTV